MDADQGLLDAPLTDRHTTEALPTALPQNLPQRSPSTIGPEISTPVLRRCTALATRARVDLLSASRHTAADELERLLASLESWDPAALADPDPTMTVLAAAALQDLAGRLPSSARSTLGAHIETVLDLLHTLMDGARHSAMA